MVAWVGLVYRALPPSNGKVDLGSQGRAVREADKQDFTYIYKQKYVQIRNGILLGPTIARSLGARLKNNTEKLKQ
jgi:hypothetical protein